MLNEKLSFSGLTAQAQKSFRASPAPVLVSFPKGTRFYKWTSYPLLRWEVSSAGRKAVISPFWSSMDGFTTPSGQVVPKFTETRKRYANKGGGVGAPRDWARARSAVTQEWNSMDAILFMQLDQLVWGYVGLAGPQPMREGHPDVVWIGGDWQIVIPGLTEAHCHQIG